MTCHCHDPLVFGHHACGRETQGWNQPPLHTYAGETPNIPPGGAAMYGRLEDGYMIYDEVIPLHAFIPTPNRGVGDWLELGQTNRFRIQLRELDEPCA